MANTRFQKGHIMSPEIRKKISDKLKGIKKPQETIAKMKLAQKGRICTEQQKLRQSISMSGRKYTEERLKKCKDRFVIKENHPNWKGGITPLYLQIRHHFKMRQWISDCFHRDDFTCQECGVRGNKLNCHHIKHFSEIICEWNIKTLEEALVCDELWDLNNGVTLCRDCHNLIHKKNV